MMSPPTLDCAVLLVDDCKEHCALTERALRHARPATRCVTLDSGDAAIRHLGECGQDHARPELLLLDWRMPGRSGEEVLVWARAQPHLLGLPILVLSGVAYAEDRQRAAELGADGYLVKPNNLDGYDVLAQEVDNWRGRFAVAALVPSSGPMPDAAPSHWERGARVLRTVVGGWVRSATAKRAAEVERDYVEAPVDQLTADLVRLCRAQGILPRNILRNLPAGVPCSPLTHQRRMIIRGLARRGWDTHELAEVFPLTPAAIRLLVHRR